MIIAIMQPYFFPYIGYYQLANLVDKFVFYDDVNYIKGGWINRNRINVNKQDTYLSVKTFKASPFKKINDIALDKNEIWRKKLVKKIYFAYKKSKNFDKCFQIIERILNFKTEYLSELNKKSIVDICNYLEIETEFIDTSTVFNNSELKSQERVINICNQLKATCYVNPIGGQMLYKIEDFGQLDLKFISSTHGCNLSIIDILMNNDKSEINQILKEYVLI